VFNDKRLQPSHTVVLDCPGKDSIRMWPLPVVDPWVERRKATLYLQVGARELGAVTGSDLGKYRFSITFQNGNFNSKKRQVTQALPIKIFSVREENNSNHLHHQSIGSQVKPTTCSVTCWHFILFVKLFIQKTLFKFIKLSLKWIVFLY